MHQMTEISSKQTKNGYIKVYEDKTRDTRVEITHERDNKSKSSPHVYFKAYHNGEEVLFASFCPDSFTTDWIITYKINISIQKTQDGKIMIIGADVKNIDEMEKGSKKVLFAFTGNKKLDFKPIPKDKFIDYFASGIIYKTD